MRNGKRFFLFSINPVFLVAFGTGGSIFSWLAALMGGWDSWLQCLSAFMAVDFIMGLYCAFKGKSTKTESGTGSSQALIDGIFKKASILAVVLICYQLEVASAVQHIRNGIIIAFIVGEGTSLIENWGLLGWPMPEKFKEILDVLKNRKE